MVKGESRPNIMLVVADDLGYNDVGFEEPNLSVVQTPTLSRLAKAGVRFANHHVQPFCSPTRACLMTGRHVLRYGAYTCGSAPSPLAERCN
jgi:arylsulfatase A-like enzyme